MHVATYTPFPCVRARAKLSVSLPVPNWGNESQRRADSEDKPILAHHSDLPPLSNHGSSLSEAAEATARSLPPGQGSDRGPPDTETHVSPYSRHGRSRSSTIRPDARSEAPTQRTPGLRTYPLPKAREGGLQIPERIVLITRRIPGRSPPSANRSIRSKEYMSLVSLQHIELDLDSAATNFISTFPLIAHKAIDHHFISID